MEYSTSNGTDFDREPPFQQIVAFDLGPPIAATVPAGQCAFGTSWTRAPLLSRINISVDTGLCTRRCQGHSFVAEPIQIALTFVDAINMRLISNIHTCEIYTCIYWTIDDHPNTAVVLTFGLGDTQSSLELSTCACLVASGGGVARAYTPISTNAVSVLLGGIVDIIVLQYHDGMNCLDLEERISGELLTMTQQSHACMET